MLNHRGTKRFVYDTNPAAITPQNALETAIGDLGALPQNAVDYALILTPADSHLEYIKWAFERGLPVVVEKPLVTGHADADALEKLLHAPHPPLYCVDWAIEHGKPLLMALGQPVSFPDAIRQSGRMDFDCSQLIAIRGKWMRGESTVQLGVDKKRAWAKNIHAGAGMLYDNAIHMLNLLAVAGLEFPPGSVPDAWLGMESGTRSTYPAAKPGQAEQFVRIKGAMRRRAAPEKPIPVTLAAGWNAAKQECYLELEDKKGHKLRWEMYPSRVECLDKNRHVMATMTLDKESHCYDRIIDDATRFIEENRKKSLALYAPEHLAMIHAAAAIHESRENTGAPDGFFYQVKPDPRGPKRSR